MMQKKNPESARLLSGFACLYSADQHHGGHQHHHGKEGQPVILVHFQHMQAGAALAAVVAAGFHGHGQVTGPAECADGGYRKIKKATGERTLSPAIFLSKTSRVLVDYFLQCSHCFVMVCSVEAFKLESVFQRFGKGQV